MPQPQFLEEPPIRLPELQLLYNTTARNNNNTMNGFLTFFIRLVLTKLNYFTIKLVFAGAGKRQF